MKGDRGLPDGFFLSVPKEQREQYHRPESRPDKGNDDEKREKRFREHEIDRQ